MLNPEFAEHFAQEWIAAWNAHDLARILAHYTEDFDMSSPYITQFTGEASGTLKGKAAVAAYWTVALQRLPDLHFELEHVLVGADSITLLYRRQRNLAAEVFFFDAAGLVRKACAHYGAA